MQSQTFLGFPVLFPHWTRAIKQPLKANSKAVVSRGSGIQINLPTCYLGLVHIWDYGRKCFLEEGKGGNLQNCRISVFFLHSRHFSFSTSISRSPLFSADDVCHSNSNSSKKKSQALAESQKLAAGLAGLSGLCAPSATDFSGRKSVFCTLPLQSTLLLSSGAGQETSKWPSIHFAAW